MLAERAGIHSTYLSGIERGVRKITFTVLLRLLKALETNWSAFGRRLSRHDLNL